MKGRILAKSNTLEAGIMVLMEEQLDLAFISRFANCIEYRKLANIRKKVNKKDFMKYVKALKTFKDFKENKNILTGKLGRLLVIAKNNAGDILSIVRRFTDELHMFEENFVYLNENNNSDELFKVFVNISKFDSNSFFKILLKINYPKIRDMVLNKKAKKEIILQIDKFDAGIVKTRECFMNRKIYGYNWRNRIKNQLLKNSRNKNTTYISKIKDKNFTFIKNQIIADYWGKETLCCLKFGGAAKELLEPIEFSPLAGEIVGTIGKTKVMSYVWDMIEIVDGVAYKTLILDNIEASPKMNENDTIEFLEIMKKAGKKYKSIYCGTIRNDASIPTYIKDTKKPRQSKLINYEHLEGFSYADSNIMHTVVDRPVKTDFVIRRMDVTALFQVKYLEQYMYPGFDEDFLNNIRLDTPCHVIESETTIGGYFVTRYKYFKKNTKTFNQDHEVHYSEYDETKHIKILYIEDLVIAPNKKLISLIKDIIIDLLDYCRKNNHDTVMLNSNENSIGLAKRLEKNGLVVIEDDLETLSPEFTLKYIEVDNVINKIGEVKIEEIIQTQI